MKNFYLAVVMAILLPFSIFAKPISSTDVQKYHLNKSMDISTIKITPNDIIDVKVGDFPAPQLAFKTFIPNSDYFWTTLFEGLTPFTYEPKSGTLIYVTTRRELRMSDTVQLSHIVFYFSKDNGQTWTDQIVHTYENALLFFPSVAVLNPTNATDPIDFKYVVSCTPYLPVVQPDGSTSFSGKGSYYVYFYGKIDGVSSWNNIEYNVENFPIQNNQGGPQLWALTEKRMCAVSSPKGDHFYIYGTLQRANEGIQHGAYGLGYVNFTEGAEPLSQIPEAWGLDKFRDPGGLGSTWNAPLRLDTDEEGNVYAFFNNMYPDDEDKRIPGFSKSTDNGRTWSQIQKMPYARVTDYLALYNHNMAFNYHAWPYTSWDAVVTGVDEFSMFLRFFIGEGQTAETTVCQGHIVEASYKAGVWQPMRRVGDYRFEDGYQYYPPQVINYTNTDGAFTTNDKDEIEENYRYEELEASKAADGSGIVVKWITPPPTNNVAKLATPKSLYNNPAVTLDEIPTTDIIVAVRAKESNQWQEFNVTQDLWYNKGTYLVKPVPSINTIPIAENITQRITDPNNYRATYPYFLLNIVGDRNWGPVITETRSLYSAVIGVFNPTNPTSLIRNSEIQRPDGLVGMSIHENLPFAIQHISPNPAIEVAQITFNLDINADVKIDITNSMGQVLKTKNVSNAQIGENSVNIMINDLSAGAYFYTITVNGKSQTKLLNVVR